jgi:hypothetical protein
MTTRTLAKEADAVLGDAPGSLLAMPREALGAEAWTVASARGGQAIARVPAGVVAFRERRGAIPMPFAGPAEVRLAAFDVVSLPIGAFMVHVTAAEATAETATAARRRALPPFVPHAAAAALVHAAVMALSAQASSSATIEDTMRDAEEARRYLAAAEARSSAVDKVFFGGEGTSHQRQVDERAGNGAAAGGKRAEGKQGSMGSAESRAGTKNRAAVARDPEASDKDMSTARSEALADARSFGMAGLLAEGAADGPTAAFGRELPDGADPLSARGGLWGASFGETFGSGGLGLSGTGEGGGGRGEGIGLGSIGALGHGAGLAGSGFGGAGHHMREWWDGHYERVSYVRREQRRRLREAPVKVTLTVSTRPAVILPGDGGANDVAWADYRDQVHRTVRQKLQALKSCYDYYGAAPRNKDGRLDPKYTGSVGANLLVGRSGSVLALATAGVTLHMPSVVDCVALSWRQQVFPSPPSDGGARVLVRVHFSSAPPAKK